MENSERVITSTRGFFFFTVAWTTNKAGLVGAMRTKGAEETAEAPERSEERLHSCTIKQADDTLGILSHSL